MEINHNILVPFDFTLSSKYAISHASSYLRVVGGKITILHVLKDNKNKDKILSEIYEFWSKKEKFQKQSYRLPGIRLQMQL